MALRVLVIGGGIGGLCLAHGLQNAGLDVAVYEQGPRLADPHWLQGYQIHLDRNGATGLKQCLPEPLFDKVNANACRIPSGFQILSEQMDQIGFVEPEVIDFPSHVPIVRTTLRDILLEQLDGIVWFDKAFTHYVCEADGSVTAYFADGTSASGDVLVGADGTGSKVREQYLPEAKLIDTAWVGAAAKLPLDTTTRGYLPEHLTTRLSSILPRNDAYMIVTQSIQKPNREHSVDDHLIWVLVSRLTAYGVEDPRQLSSEQIKSGVLKLMEGWHPDLRKMVRDQASEPLSVVKIISSTPVRAGRGINITLLGDAIHTMTPLQGLGGSTALRDAGLLRAKMIAAEAGSNTVSKAIDEYETEMIKYAFDAVRISKRFGDLVLAQNSLVRAAFRFAVRLTAGSPAIKRYLFKR